MRIAVIGHGRSPEGKGWASNIDSCDVVVRMWDWAWQDPIDYGEKYDFGLLVLAPKTLRIFRAENKCTPSRSFLGYRLKVTTEPLPEPMIEVLPWEWHAAAKKLGGRGFKKDQFNLTRGGCAAAWAITRYGEDSEVTLVGYDNLVNQAFLPVEEAFSPQYLKDYTKQYGGAAKWKLDFYGAGETKSASHDIVAEKLLLEQLAEHHAVTLRYAQEAW